MAATLGHVLEIDMNTITHEKIRAKVGVRDYDRIPTHTEITDKDLMIYRVMPELESVVEVGWYGDLKRQSQEGDELEKHGEELRKRQKNHEGNIYLWGV